MSGLVARVKRLAEERAERRREAIAETARGLGVEILVEGDAVRLSGRGLMRRWMSDLTLRVAGRDEL